MSPPIIAAENVSKTFVLHRRELSLRHEALGLLRGALGRRPAPPPFYAVRDLSFTMQPGESLAIIGRNGAGKSTLLRLLAGIFTPSAGRIVMRGRVAALIGLGAGFLPTLTGRENIHLSAALYGLAPRELRMRLDAIIDFAELGEFIDVPVKDYSSGMQARLGFSVAAHVAPEILLLDEVFAVGDAAFQQKCMHKIIALRDEGRSLVFVSHAAGAVRWLCERALWLHEGALRLDGPTEEVLAAYHAFLGETP